MGVKLLFMAGSMRKASVNKKLAKAACKLAEAKGASATFIDLQDFTMPLYDEDWEEAHGLPDTAIRLKRLFADHDGIFIASPEHNSAYSALLKNTLDWISRSHEENEIPLTAFRGKVAAISGASPGSLGGMRGLVSLKMLLGNIQVTVLPNQLALTHAFEAFDDAGNLVNAQQKAALEVVIERLIAVTGALNA